MKIRNIVISKYLTKTVQNCPIGFENPDKKNQQEQQYKNYL